MWKYLNKKLKTTGKEGNDANIEVPPTPQGSPEDRVDRPEEINSGIKVQKQKGVQIRTPR